MSTDITFEAAAPTPRAAPPARETAGYRGLWRMLPRELGYLLLNLPVAVIVGSVLQSVFWSGLSLVAIFVGIFVVVAALYIARWAGAVELHRLRWSGRAAIAPPRWPVRATGDGFWRTLMRPVTNGHYWLALLHGLIVNFALGILSWTITLAWASTALGGLTFWFWSRFLPNGERGVWLHRVVLDFLLPSNTVTINPLVGESIFMFIVGVVLTLSLPLVTRTLTSLHHAVARGLLGAWPSERLQREVVELSASRGAAVAAEDRSLRRLERDIHDGPQQRLVRLQMDLAAAERKLASDPAAAAALLSEARGQAQDTLDELRALSRGLVPPILADRGLATALASLADRSPIPVVREIVVAPDARLAPEVERSAYFVAAELLTNAAKHSGAASIRLRVEVREGTALEGDWLDLWVIDDGRGGAVARDGHGLHGLEERLRGLRGRLVVESPVGGPTTIGAHIRLGGDTAA